MLLFLNPFSQSLTLSACLSGVCVRARERGEEEEGEEGERDPTPINLSGLFFWTRHRSGIKLCLFVLALFY